MKYSIIYKAVNTITDEVYIGATTKSIEERKEDHIQKANKKVGSYFQEAIGTYGPEAFTWEAIDTACNNDELAAKEIKYILENNAVEDGYNSDHGGGFRKTVYQYNLDGTPINSFKDLTSAATSVNATKKSISKACWNVNHTLKGYLWSYEYKEKFIPDSDNRKKEVLQYNLNGNLLAQYISVAEASRKSGLSKTCISRCCRKERDQSGGFIWKYS
ncbi:MULTISPECIES: NUMOD1 domain-containing DNA-binding protein [Flavobacterium]|uniref:Endonuclease n=1 Tax=Flavobacterium gawalongense TaxID=2594432 RepID=A0A553BW83_9FLAO|nr:NUMOD1 domain-containing DNA-binding protein [Flavobacterium gawalongense]TRX12524.1 endonuclease [Flavobacterium gawalongense]TRX12655.1 endonuclease [Flavobacterium gawalongense]TRX30556.1 endonuclease [Flavobacterium gawalongense]